MQILAPHRLALVLIFSLLGFSGTACRQSSSPPPNKTVSHAEHAETGPHGGALIMFANHALHAEIVLDEATGKITIYTLGSNAKQPVLVAADGATMYVNHDGHSDKFVLKPAPQQGDSAGETSRFTLESRHLVKALGGKARQTAQMNLTRNGKRYVGKFENHGHDDHGHGDHGHGDHGHGDHGHGDHGHGDHGHGDHGHGEAAHATSHLLLWHEEGLKLAGYTIGIGQHGLVVQAGHDLEPAVTIEHDGKPVTDAKVFVSLLEADKKNALLAKEKLTTYEPATSEEPAHYAQAFLKVPAHLDRVIIRYRIELPHGAGSESYDIPIHTESDPH